MVQIPVAEGSAEATPGSSVIFCVWKRSWALPSATPTLTM